MYLFLTALFCAVATGLRLRSASPVEESIIEPITPELITDEPVQDASKFTLDEDGNLVDASKPVPLYRANKPDVYKVEPVLNSSLSENSLELGVNPDEMNMCKYMTTQAKIDNGCLGQQ